MLKKYKYPVWLFLAALLCSLGAYFYFYWLGSSFTISNSHINHEIETVLNRAVEEFDSLSYQLETKSEEIEQLVLQAHNSGSPGLALYQRLPDDLFWGITIIKNGQKWVWKGFDVTPSLSFRDFSIGTSISTRNNSIILQRINTLPADDDNYIVLTAFLISKTSELPFDDNQQEFTDRFSSELQYPVSFNFFGSFPDSSRHKNLTTSEGDTLGVVYAEYSDALQYQGDISNRLRKWSTFFEILSSFLVIITLFFIAFYSRSKTIYFIYLALIFTGWFLIFQYSLYDSWVTEITLTASFTSAETSKYLVIYGIHAVFILFTFLGIHNLLLHSKQKLTEDQHFRTFGFSLLFSFIAAAIAIFSIKTTFDILSNGDLSLIDLDLAPSISAFVFYLEAIIFLGSTIGLIFSIGHYLQFLERGKSVIIALLSSFGFFISIYFLNIFIDFPIFERFNLIPVSLLFFSSLLGTFLIEKYPVSYGSMSGFRRLMLLVLAVSVTLYILIWNTYNKQLDANLTRYAAIYIDEEEQEPREILTSLLTNLEQNLSILTRSDFENRRLPVANLFQRSVLNYIQNIGHTYSFNIRLIEPDNTQLTSYSMSIDSPAWISYFNAQNMLMRYNGERIRWQANRPVIWGRPANSPDQYTSFERGWIPVYDQHQPETIIAWIAGDIFKERLDYNKPIRAILSNTEEDWKNSIYISAFTDNRLIDNSLSGLYRNQPHYLRLPQAELDIASQDSINFFTNITREHTFREVLIQAGENRVVKASTPLPGFNLHFFSFFKMQIVMIFFGLFCCSVLELMGFHRMSLFGQNRKFSSRLIDGLALSTILLLTVLIIATRYTLTEQNQRNIERDLLNNLNGINESLQLRTNFLYNQVEANSLSNITTPLSVDLILYRNEEVEVSSTPQIFQQYILPTTMPFIAYDNLFNRGRASFFTTEVINNEVLLIGFQSILNAEGNPAGAIAIPTFVESPVFVEQLLEATSYLFVLYLGMFSLFIAGTVLLSSRLTRPLTVIQKGLRNISEGDTQTKIPVTSQDEIGSLASAYNQMVERLDDARKELVKAERESAWKEMAQQVAHEIKNPLTPMKLNLQHLQRQLDQNPEKAQNLKPLIEKTANNIIQQIESLNKIASDFSKFAKPMHSPKKNIVLEDILQSVVQLYEHNEDVQIRLKFNNHHQVTIAAAEDELRRVFINIIKNAIEAAKNLPAKIDLNVALQKRDKFVQIAIKDYGEGISEEDKENIFRPQFSTKSSGTGLGLAISKKIVEAHDGSITFTSKAQKGSTFTLTLPYVNA